MQIDRSKLIQCDYNFAILIGIDEYPLINAGLHTPVKDATALRDVLLKHQGYKEEEVLLITNPTRAELGIFFDRLLLLQGQEPDPVSEGALSVHWRAALSAAHQKSQSGELVFPKAETAEQKLRYAQWETFLEHLARFREERSNEQRDSLLFYYAGHGLAGEVGKKGPAGYFLPSDTKNHANRLAHNETLLPMEQVFTTLHAFASHHTLLVLDCCFAGTFSRINTTRATILGFRLTSRPRFEQYIKKRAWQVLVSAGPSDLASDFVSDRGEISGLADQTVNTSAVHSPFAHALLQALNKEQSIDVKPRGRNLGDGVITAHELFLYLHRRVDEIIKDDTNFNPQTPDYFTMGDHFGGQFIFVDPRHPKNEPDWSQTNTIIPYKGLAQMDTEDHPFYFGREQDVAQLKYALSLALDVTEPAEQAIQQNSPPLAEEKPGLVLVTGASGCGKSSLVKAGLIPQLMYANYTVFMLRPGHHPWTLQMCRRFTWRVTTTRGRNSNTLAFELPLSDDTEDKTEWVDMTEMKPQKREELIMDRFRAYLSKRECHPLEKQWLQEELAILLTSIEKGRHELNLRGNWKWQTVTEEDALQFELLPPAPADNSKPKFDDQHVNLQEKQVFYIDQYEELFTACTSEERSFLEEQLTRCLEYAAAGEGYLLLSIRSDFEWQLELSSFGQQFWQDQPDNYYKFFKLHRLTELGLDDLRSALINPALMQAYEFQDGLTDEILEDLDYLPNGLPLLSLTMQQMVKFTQDRNASAEREDRTFRQDTYRDKIGRVGGALAKVMDDLYQGLGPAETDHREGEEAKPSTKQRLFRKILLRMVSLSDGDYARRRVFIKSNLNELAFAEDNSAVEEILNGLIKTNLVSRGGDTTESNTSGARGLRRRPKEPYVELMHDALINSWSKGKQWINDFGKDNLLLQRQLWQAVTDSSKPPENTDSPQDKGARVAAVINPEFSQLWDTNPKLIQVIQYISDHSQFLLEKKHQTAVLEEIPENQRDRFRKFWTDCQTKKEFPDLNSLVLSGHSDKLLKVLLKRGEHWLNLAEVAFIKQSWAERIKDILALQRERDEAKATALSAQAREILPRDSTAALNLVAAAYAITPNARTTSALHDVLSQNNHYYLWSVRDNIKAVRSVKYSAKHQLFLFAGDDELAMLLDLTREKEPLPLKHKRRLFSADISPDGEHILTGGLDKIGRIWKRSGGDPIELKGHTDQIYSVAFSPTELKVITASVDGTARLWDMDGKELQIFEGHEGKIYSVAFSPDGQSILTGGHDKTAKLWNLNGKVEKTFLGHTNGVFSVAFSPDGESILTAGGDKTARLWNMKEEGQLVKKTLLPPLKKHSAGIHSAIFHPDGKSILTGSKDNKVIWWDMQGQIIETIPNNGGEIFDLAIPPDNASVAVASETGIRGWPLREKAPYSFKVANDTINDLAALKGNMVATATGEHNVKLLDLSKGTTKELVGHEGVVNSIAYHASSGQFITGSEDQSVILWQPEGVLEKRYKLDEAITSVAFQNDGEYMLLGTKDGNLYQWKLTSRTPKTPRSEYSGYGTLRSIALSPDGNFFVTAAGRKVGLWSTKTLGCQTIFEAEASVYSVAFAPNGEQILISIFDGTARLINVKDPKKTTIFEGHTDGVYKAIFSPDGKTILTASRDKTVKLWKLDGQQLTTFTGHTDKVYSLGFSPQGDFIFSGGADHTIKVWRNLFRELTYKRLWKKVYQFRDKEREHYGINWKY
ncbi:MAG: caspase family protein [Bacteroidota bacterium]